MGTNVMIEALVEQVSGAPDNDARAQLGVGSRRVFEQVQHEKAVPLGQDDALRILAARVVGGDDGDVGAPHDRLAHEGALGAVAVAAAAEDDDKAPGAMRAQCRQDGVQRVGRVGVVAQHDAWLLGEALHAPGHLGYRPEPRGDPLDPEVRLRASRVLAPRVGDRLGARRRTRRPTWNGGACRGRGPRRCAAGRRTRCPGAGHRR
mgnify:CR=1 FL=1